VKVRRSLFASNVENKLLNSFADCVLYVSSNEYAPPEGRILCGTIWN